MEYLSLKQLISLHSKNKYLLLVPNTPSTCDNDKSYIPTTESNDDFVNNDDQSEINSINYSANITNNPRSSMTNDKIIIIFTECTRF